MRRSAGVRIYTDAIDNSAGVDTSDHEVNIKILLGLPIADGELTEKQRNTLLAEMTDDVAALVLRDNYFQTQVLSVDAPHRAAAARRSRRASSASSRRAAGSTARSSSCRRDDEIAERKARGVGLTTPERAVLLAYSKMWLYDELMASDLPDDPWVGTALQRYFPAQLREKYGAYMPRHPLQARDHRHARAQQHGQPRRQHLRAPADGDDRRHAGAGRARLPAGARDLRPRGAVAADRGARQQGRRRRAVRRC